MTHVCAAKGYWDWQLEQCDKHVRMHDAYLYSTVQSVEMARELMLMPNGQGVYAYPILTSSMMNELASVEHAMHMRPRAWLMLHV